MKHGSSSPSLDATPPTPPLTQWNVYSADRHLVAIYSTQAGAAGHVASWPALYYSEVPATVTSVGLSGSAGIAYPLEPTMV